MTAPLTPYQPDAWRPRPRILCPKFEPEVCDCGSTEFEERGNGDRLAIRCKGCGDVEIESPLDILGMRDNGPSQP